MYVHGLFTCVCMCIHEASVCMCILVYVCEGMYIMFTYVFVYQRVYLVACYNVSDLFVRSEVGNGGIRIVPVMINLHW